MELIFFDEPQQFLNRAGEFLCRREAENNLILGSAARAVENPPATPPLMLAVTGAAGEIVAAAMQTPPHNLILTDAPVDLIRLIARELKERGRELPGVFAPVAAAQSFVDEWRRLNPRLQQTCPPASLRAYQLDRVIWPADSPAGSFLEAGE